MQTPHTEQKASDQTDEHTALEGLHQLRDEIRLKMHLAGMEAKEKWQELEGQLDSAAKVVSDTTDSAAKLMDDTKENARGALEDLRARFEIFRESIKHATGH
jgi:transposase